MNEIKIFDGQEVEVIEVNGQVLFNPYHVGKCLDMAEGTVKDHMSRMGEKQAVLVKNSDMHNAHIQNPTVGLTNFRKLNNAVEKFQIAIDKTCIVQYNMITIKNNYIEGGIYYVCKKEVHGAEVIQA